MAKLEKLLLKIEACLRTFEFKLLTHGNDFKEVVRKIENAQDYCTADNINLLLPLLREIYATALASSQLKKICESDALNLSILYQQLHSYSLGDVLLQEQEHLVGLFVRLDNIMDGLRIFVLSDKNLNQMIDETSTSIELIQRKISRKLFKDEIGLVQDFSLLSEKIRNINLLIKSSGKADSTRQDMVRAWNAILDTVVDALEETQQRLHPRTVVLRGTWGGVRGVQIRT